MHSEALPSHSSAVNAQPAPLPQPRGSGRPTSRAWEPSTPRTPSASARTIKRAGGSEARPPRPPSWRAPRPRLLDEEDKEDDERRDRDHERGEEVVEAPDLDLGDGDGVRELVRADDGDAVRLRACTGATQRGRLVGGAERAAGSERGAADAHIAATIDVCALLSAGEACAGGGAT